MRTLNERDMQLLKQKLKTKKYQYLYLQMRLIADDSERDKLDSNIGGHPLLNTHKYYDWLEKINKKYNYA